jgi:NAD(P)-dependent dehydrogenase (short-subunit alcohol dehydrogenase family)
LHLGYRPFEGKVAVVTGAGQGIGREAARALARHGASVVVAEIRDTGSQTAALIREEGGRALFVRTDVSDPASVEALRVAALGAFGRVDILVNNACTYVIKPVLETGVDEWDRVFAVNLRGTFLATRAFLPGMLERHDGVVLTFESAEGMPFLASYMASKVGLRSLATSLAAEVGEDSGVAVFCFGAGMVETPGGVQAFRAIAPLLGTTYEEFIRNSFGGLITPEACALGMVGTILNAREYHGGEADFFAGLQKLGRDREGKPVGENPSAPPAARPAPPRAAAGLPEALAAGGRLVAHADEMAEEVHRLPVYARPIVRRMFHTAVGVKIDEWPDQARALVAALERGPMNASAAAGHLARLDKLLVYLRKQEKDAPGWVKDAEMLEAALKALADRIDAAQRTRDGLARVAAPPVAAA